MKTNSIKFTLSLLTLFSLSMMPLFSQDLEPRRWTVIPVGTNVIGIGYGHTFGDLLLDPVLQVENAVVKVDTLAVSYIRSFSLAGKTVRFDAFLPWHSAKWEGILRGTPASTERKGFGDSRFRLSVNLLNTSTEYSQEVSHTAIGAGVAVTLPTGEYDKDKLINLGHNRFSIRPQLGVLHTHGAWSYELTGSVFFFTDNNDYFNDGKREQDPLYALQTHVVHIFKPGLWASIGAGYGWGGNSTINAEKKDDKWDNFMASLSMGVPLSRSQGIKLNYIHAQTQNLTGSNTDTLSMSWSVRF